MLVCPALSMFRHFPGCAGSMASQADMVATPTCAARTKLGMPKSGAGGAVGSSPASGSQSCGDTESLELPCDISLCMRRKHTFRFARCRRPAKERARLVGSPPLKAGRAGTPDALPRQGARAQPGAALNVKAVRKAEAPPAGHRPAGTRGCRCKVIAQGAQRPQRMQSARPRPSGRGHGTAWSEMNGALGSQQGTRCAKIAANFPMILKNVRSDFVGDNPRAIQTVQEVTCDGLANHRPLEVVDVNNQ